MSPDRHTSGSTSGTATSSTARAATASKLAHFTILIGRHAIWEQNGSSKETEADEYTRAATAYVAWPLALFELARRSTGSLWYRTHLRQAAVLGIVLTAGLLAVLALPLVVVLSFSWTDSTATIRVYLVALVIDTVVFGAATALVIRCVLRAGRGEIFELAFITPLSERLFRARAKRGS
jgi:hypothetical protein